MSAPLHIVTAKWTPRPGYRSTFGPETVNAMKRMVDRWYTDPHQVWCFTDDPDGIDPSVTVRPLWNDFAELPSPHGGKNPSCYRRLRFFAPEMADVIGERLVLIDLDCVLHADVRPLWNRTEDIVLYGDTNPRTHYNGSMTLMTAGCRAKVWDAFDPKASPRKALDAGFFGSDQAWLSYCLGPGEAKWTPADGVYSYRNHIRPKGDTLPPNARVTIWHGAIDPWVPRAQAITWVRESYGVGPSEVAA